MKQVGFSKPILIIVGVILIALFGLGWIFNRSAFCSVPFLNVPCQSSFQIPGRPQSVGQSQEIIVKSTGAKYKVASAKPAGWFSSGQDADIMLSGIDFNNTGGPLLFNHPGTVTSDGTHLLLADRNNNRVLIWNKLPTSNTPPDLVLGQKDFVANNPGTELDQMNWPCSVSVAGGKLVVTDTNNNRILIWNSFPTQNGQRADLVINSVQGNSQQLQAEKKRNILWPWGVWTDGKKLAITSTMSGVVLLWDSFPTQNDQPADIYLTVGGKIGTPRTITSDGNHLIVGDHNARISGSLNPGEGGQIAGMDSGNFFWKSWPTADDTPDDFFMADPTDHGTWMQGALTGDDKLIMIGGGLNIWNSFPQSSGDKPDLVVGRGGAPIPPGAAIPSTYTFRGGDASSVSVVDNRIFISLYNGNKIVVYNSTPERSDQKPDFAIGSPDVDTNTLETNFIIENPLPVTDGEHLFVSGRLDGKAALYVWRKLPDESGAHPDLVYSLISPNDVFDIALFGKTLALAGGNHPGAHVYIWKNLPLNGEMPDSVFSENIGNVRFKDVSGVSMDNKYFYLADRGADKIYVWEGIPDQNSNPKFIINIDRPGRLSTDGNYLVETSPDTRNAKGSSVVRVYKIADLSQNPQPYYIGGLVRPGIPDRFSLPLGSIVSQGHLFVADTGFNKVHIWKRIEDAILGKDEDIILGSQENNPVKEIGRNKLFMPAALTFDGSYLWVGEFKFSKRLLRFSVH